MLVVVSDTSPLIYLSWIGQFDLLRQIYGTVLVPDAVWNEMTRGGELIGFNEILAAVEAGWIRIETVTANRRVLELVAEGIGVGESEAIALAADFRAILIIDDNDGRRVARRLGVEMTGTLGVLVRAKRENRLLEIRPLLLRLMLGTNFRLGRRIIDAALADVGEPPV